PVRAAGGFAPWFLFLPALPALFGACSGASATSVPVASVSSSTEAQIAFAPLRDAWSTQSKRGRAELRGPVTEFLRRFGTGSFESGAVPVWRSRCWYRSQAS